MALSGAKSYIFSPFAGTAAAAVFLYHAKCLGTIYVLLIFLPNSALRKGWKTERQSERERGAVSHICMTYVALVVASSVSMLVLLAVLVSYYVNGFLAYIQQKSRVERSLLLLAALGCSCSWNLPATGRGEGNL